MNHALSIAIIGVGGIGSNVAALLIPSLSQGDLATKFENIKINLYDSDEVEESNIFHQRFFPSNIGEKKVNATYRNLKCFENGTLNLFHSSTIISNSPRFCFRPPKNNCEYSNKNTTKNKI